MADRPAAGHLLVASPALLDPNFAGTVVLLLDSDEDGALGVVINRPSTVRVGDVLDPWADVASSPGVLFEGGPVSGDTALGVAVLPATVPADAEPVGWRRMYDRTGLVDLDAPAELVAPAVAGVRIFAGYAGWGGDQIMEELAEGAWYVVPALESDLLTELPEQLWSRVLRRQPGELAWVANRPADPTSN